MRHSYVKRSEGIIQNTSLNAFKGKRRTPRALGLLTLPMRVGFPPRNNSVVLTRRDVSCSSWRIQETFQNNFIVSSVQAVFESLYYKKQINFPIKTLPGPNLCQSYYVKNDSLEVRGEKDQFLTTVTKHISIKNKGCMNPLTTYQEVASTTKFYALLMTSPGSMT